jgi:hypothetical protein
LLSKCPPEGGRYKNASILSFHTDSWTVPLKPEKGERPGKGSGRSQGMGKFKKGG